MIVLAFYTVAKDKKCALRVPAKQSKIEFFNLAGIGPNSRHTKSVAVPNLLNLVNYAAVAIVLISQLALTTS